MIEIYHDNGNIVIETLKFSQRAIWSQGQPISDLMSRALANPGLISLAAGFVDQQSLPVAATAVTEIFDRPGGVVIWPAIGMMFENINFA